MTTGLLKRCAACRRLGEVVQSSVSFNIEWSGPRRADEAGVGGRRRPRASRDRMVGISELVDPNYKCGACEDGE